MQKVVENIKELYERSEPVGEVIVDQVVALLRMKPKLQDVRMMAALLDVSLRGLSEAWLMLTGMELRTAITEWRLLQAQEMIRQGVDLKMVAQNCGWRALGSMNHVFTRHYGFTAVRYAKMIKTK